MQFTKLRLYGFKSFVEPTELAIESGLTGIVGPNGCGKSNLVEALRWVMGENRAKQMRGGEMDDVIFAGTADRPSRNVAEVALIMDNAARKAPAAFNDLLEIEVSRRIERGEGSAYRIAGREVRARDVQLMFADAATGSHSPALVSQGRISAIIAAKPTERRALLEEAAGISGLHSRRHEAELKLRAAEANLARLDDVIVTLDGQYQGLRKQARQAARYRNMSDLIRRAEAILMHLRWREASASRDAALERLAAAERLVAEITQRAAVASTALAEAQATLPDLRRAEADEATSLARLGLAREQLEADERRVTLQLEEIAARLAHLAADRAREEQHVVEATETLSRLSAERASLVGAEAGALDARRESEIALEAARAEVDEIDAEVARATEMIAACDAERDAIQRQTNELGQRIAAERARLAEIARERALLETAIAARNTAAGADDPAATAQARQSTAEATAEEAEAARRAAFEEEAGARARLAAAEAELGRIAAEMSGLEAALGAGGGEFDLVLDHVSVSPGYEPALGAALGDDLAAALEAGAPVHWRTLKGKPDDAPALPAGAESLAGHVEAPPALALRLAQIGVVDDDVAGEKLSRTLKQGQRLVSRDGGLWRWDGFTVAPGAPTAAATRLAQRNRLDKLKRSRAAAAAELDGAKIRFAAAETSARAMQRAEQQARDAARQAIAALAAAQADESARTRAEASDAARLQALSEEAGRAHSGLAQDESRLEDTRMRLAAMPDSSGQRAKLAADRGRLSMTRTNLAELQGTHGRLAREAEIRAERIAAIGDERAMWSSRAVSARTQMATLAGRAQTASADQERLARRPDEIAAERNALFDRIEEAEARRRAAADKLSDAEARVAAADRALKAIEAELATQREDRVRAEALRDQAIAHQGEIAQAIGERLDCAPEDTLTVGGLALDDELPAMQQIANRLERLIKERDTMGPVNLRAEQEAAEVEQQLATMRSEKEDLVAAIARLRHGIASLNREGRERLLAAFAKVNKHFQDLFSRLFGGGRAHLALAMPAPPAPVEGEPQAAPTMPAPANDVDPLEAGLEVMASPPGKKLQSLSLLSGGEQALTALALLFAVFLTNPAPICVLDEVDAPLDDANVDRFCTLLEDTSRTTGTRFLLVTHHRLTMARMHRLFGVTMAERGISQIVSVDLRGAESMRATA